MTHIAKIIEIIGSSEKGWEEAAQVAVDGGKKTLHGIAQTGSNDTSARVNALIINEIDNSTSKASSLGTTRSLTGTQIANAIERLIASNNNGQDLELRKIVVENEAKCSSSLKSIADCNLKIRIHQ